MPIQYLLRIDFSEIWFTNIIIEANAIENVCKNLFNLSCSFHIINTNALYELATKGSSIQRMSSHDIDLFIHE